MVTVGRAYVVRDANAEPGSVDRVYPYTLRGLTDALEDARFRSYAGRPQELAVVAEGGSTVIRRYEHGREVSAGQLSGGFRPVAGDRGIHAEVVERARRYRHGDGRPGAAAQVRSAVITSLTCCGGSDD